MNKEIDDAFIVDAGLATAEHLLEAVCVIDRAFGKGYAKSNPELVSGFINGCSSHYLAARITLQMHKSSENILDSINKVSYSINDLSIAISTDISNLK